MWSRVVENSELVVCIPLLVAVVMLVRGVGREKPDEAIVWATLAGALVGGVAILLGSWIARFNEEKKTAQELDRHRAQLRTLITAELVNVAAGLIGAYEFIEAARISLESQSGTIPLDLTSHLPREMPFTIGLGIDLCTLDPAELDALITLQSNLTISRNQMRGETIRDGGSWRLQVIQLANGVRFTMEILAQCFERIAPTRKITMPGKPADLCSVVLRQQRP